MQDTISCHTAFPQKKIKKMIITLQIFIWFVGFLYSSHKAMQFGGGGSSFCANRISQQKTARPIMSWPCGKKTLVSSVLVVEFIKRRGAGTWESLSTHLNPTCDTPAQVSYSGGSKMSLRGVFTDLVTPTRRPLGRQIHRYRIAFLVASVAMVRLEVTGLHFFLCHTKFIARRKCEQS